MAGVNHGRLLGGTCDDQYGVAAGRTLPVPKNRLFHTRARLAGSPWGEANTFSKHALPKKGLYFLGRL